MRLTTFTNMQHLLCLFFLLFTLHLSAQEPYSYVPQNRWDNYLAMDIHDNLLVTVGFVGQCDFPKATGLTASSGTVLWEVSPETDGYGHYTDVAFASDGSIWVAGWIRDSDDLPIGNRAMLTHIDTQGEILSHFEYNITSFPLTGISQVVVLPDNRLFWSTEHEVHLLDSSGNIEDSWPTPNGNPIWQLSAVSSDFFLASTSEEVFRVDSTGETTIYYTGPAAASGIVTTIENAYWLAGIKLYSLNYSSQEENELIVNPGLFQQPRMHLRADGSLTIHSTLISPVTISSFDPLTNEITDLLTVDTPNRSVYQAIIQGVNYYLLGADLFEGETNFRKLQHGFIDYFSADTPSPKPDIQVSGLNITLDSFNLSVQDEIFYTAACHWSGEIEVSNLSDLPVENFLIASPVDGGFNCAEGRFFQTYETSIPPQGTVVVPFTYNTSLGADVDDDGDVTIDFQFCVFSAAPNHQLDAEPLNNSYCENFVVVNTEENLSQEGELQVFPNPAGHQLQIRKPGAFIEQAQLFDLTGRLVATQIIQQYDQSDFDLSHLPEGQYLLIVQTDRQLIRKSISVQR